MSTQSPSQTTTQTGYITIPTTNHKLYLSTSGPPRLPLENGKLPPAIILESGLGSSSSEWTVTQRLISHFARVYSYDRAGYGQSEVSPLPPTAQNRVLELGRLLDVAGIQPPYILVGQSYGGVLIREFLRVYGKEKVMGMVIIDSGREVNPLSKGWWELLGGYRLGSVIGLDTNHAYTEEEYEIVKRDEIQNENTFWIEESLVKESMEILNAQVPITDQALGEGRLSVVFGNRSVDFKKVLDFGIENGFGSVEARLALEKRLEGMERVDEEGQRVHLGLSSQSRFVRATGVAETHCVHYVAPELVRDEVFWVFSGCIPGL
ncbi:alpha/beta-hydrolase [Aspergillus sclerotioniger CBS 115572]|uniref:Alpha/beta-hydrolase n=1 Tax=Aspergillus sclerotioniger CBS 115572 TaxID=1450535 RepID=A0A317W471_9EURO|nr:alpha/beta-hydrolase [Aspergillus sclerotioniger CBS 115572]PWY80815.1 alpha/beta-hydrolase [Aspergillus sclerotioniger CBS 115572]